MRIGQGYDVHKLVEGRKTDPWRCGDSLRKGTVRPF